MGCLGRGGGEKDPGGDGIGEQSLMPGASDSMTREGEGEACSGKGAVTSALSLSGLEDRIRARE